MSTNRRTLLPLIVIGTVLFQLMMPIAVHADDGTPPATETPAEVTSADPGAPTDGTTGTDPATSDPTEAPLMTQVPEGTDVVVVNEDGTTEPLATQAAADAIAVSDPEWCPGLYGDVSATLPGGEGCTGSFGDFTSLLGYIAENPVSGPGTIYVSTGSYIPSSAESTSGAVTIDGASVAFSNSALIMQGSWNFTDNTVSGFSTIFGLPVDVINWNAPVTVNDITVTTMGVGTYVDASPTGAGLTVTTSAGADDRDVTLSGVQVSGVRNGDGVDVNANGDATLTDVAVTNTTGGDGIHVLATGDVTLNNLVSSANHATLMGNPGNGVYVDNTSGSENLPPSTVTLNGGTFANNDGFGAFVRSAGDIILATYGGTGVLSERNGLDGALLDTCLYDGELGCVGTGSVSVTGASLSGNHWDGLVVQSGGNASLFGVTAGNDPAILYNAGGNFNSGARIWSPDGGLLVNGGQFSYNLGDGLSAYVGGAITLTNAVSAEANGYIGASLDNCMIELIDGVWSCTGNGNVNISGGSFSGNWGDYGLFVQSSGTVSLTSVNASDNANNGAWVDNRYGAGTEEQDTLSFGGASSGTYTLSFNGYGSTLAYNATWDMIEAALNSLPSIQAVGGVWVEDNLDGTFTIHFNYPDSHHLTGSSSDFILGVTTDVSGTASSDVRVKNGNFSGNYTADSFEDPVDGGSGLTIYTSGNVSLKSVQAEDNYLDGVNISADQNVDVAGGNYSDNGYSESDLDGLDLLLGYLSGADFFGATSGAGLDIGAGGSINISKVNATDNLIGASVASCYRFMSCYGTGITTVVNSDFSENSLVGLAVASGGGIDVSRISADDQMVGTALLSYNGDIQVTNSEFYGNEFIGVAAFSLGEILSEGSGDITLKGVYEEGNGTDPVSLGGELTFLDPYLTFLSSGAVLVSSGGEITVNGNDGYFEDNPGNGLLVLSLGQVTFKNGVDASYNGMSGAYVSTCMTGLLNSIDPNLADMIGDGLCPSGVDVKIHDSEFSENGGDGLTIDSAGNVKLTGVAAEDNGGNGVTIDNRYGTGNVHIGSIDNEADGGSFSNNLGDGLEIYSAGNVKLYGVTAAGNQYYGALIDNTSGPGANLNITNSGFLLNGWTGLDAYSAGDISVDNILAALNEDGFTLDASVGDGNIWVSNSTFAMNTFAGLTARTAGGDINIEDVAAALNGDYGAGLTTTDGGLIAVTGTVDTSGATPVYSSAFDGNGTKGLWIESSGNPGQVPDVYLENVEASDNGLKGAYIHYAGPCGVSTGGIDVMVDGGSYSGNTAFGIYASVGPDGTLSLVDAPDGADNGGMIGPSLYDFYVDNTVQTCPSSQTYPPTEPPAKPFHVVNVTGTGSDVPEPIDCVTYAGYILVLPDHSKATLICTVNGEATLTATLKDKLPGLLDVLWNFLSGMDVQVTRDGQPVPVITEGGSITLSFPIPEGQNNARYSILYWDPTAKNGAGDWVEMPSLELRPDGTPMLHSLHPKLSPDDKMRIYSGLEIVDGFVRVKVNFPGTFVLVTK